MPKYGTPPAVAVELALKRLGENIARARIRRRLKQVELASKAGLTRPTVTRIERGQPTTAIGAYFSVIWAMGLEKEIANLASPDRDEEGKVLEAARQPKRVSDRRSLNDDF